MKAMLPASGEQTFLEKRATSGNLSAWGVAARASYPDVQLQNQTTMLVDMEASSKELRQAKVFMIDPRSPGSSPEKSTPSPPKP